MRNMVYGHSTMCEGWEPPNSLCVPSFVFFRVGKGGNFRGGRELIII